MWKKSLLAMLMFSPLTLAVEKTATPTTQPLTEVERIQLKQAWLADQQDKKQERERQRTNFLQLLALVEADKLTPPSLALATRLRESLTDYPLIEEADWALMKAKIKAMMVSENELASFIEKYPDTAKRNNLNQIPFEQLYQKQDFSALVAYGKTISATTILNQCRLFSAQYQLLAEQLQLNPELEQAKDETTESVEMVALLTQFDQFWLNNATLPSECQGIEAYWRDKGFKTTDKIKQKAVILFQQDAKKGLEDLITQSQSPELIAWLESVKTLLNQPTTLQIFVENQPLTPENKVLVLTTFPKFVKTLKEQIENPDFSRYQQWAEKWQLSATEVDSWKVSFISRLFDNVDPIFQLWRDEQLKVLKNDNLTERRLRLAINQKEALESWLELLSNEAKNKVEWRYWQAKQDPKHQHRLLSELAKERGFYPMLAAQALGQPYQVAMLQAKPLTDEQRSAWKIQLERITELRALNRLNQAKVLWIEWLQAVNFEEKLALSEWALQQDWYDLAVEGTIQAKAWDYIPLRLPNAYSDWFDMNLVDKPIPKSFAMAIARQESAWNPQVKSHANAIGLMQMLPSTAQKTAKDNLLPFQSERDLLEPFRNIMLGTTHLTELNAKYPNNRILIAAAYNAGASRVEQWLKRASGRLAFDEFIASIPFVETRGYVQNVLAYDYYYQILQGVKTPVMFTKEEVERKY
ncbi:putative soluble lytic murein transglycosylase [Actinobacillus minor NM305]|uniref:Putative soluble lytic murein transglycosylase n=1 Tax=Actinobacillus minor NM305 TaxID=637911 RepID=C5S299_9PAST|nr:transglycosylase SLT domain-containing protein [Actinobacillus minor]EER47026.1 putative soluble lytic murein transglycosylase [Actinobacillus minor NM305]MDY4712807.1 transglycosylase SLT domain-containing protein [Actinobacillus minor]